MSEPRRLASSRSSQHLRTPHAAPNPRLPASTSSVSLAFPQSASMHSLLAQASQVRTSGTWTTSSGELGLLSDTDEVEDRSVFVHEYNRLAKKHGVRLLVVDDFSGEQQGDAAVRGPEKRGWLQRLLRSGNEQSAASPPAATPLPCQLQVRHKRNVSELAHMIRSRLEPPRVVCIQDMVRLSGKSMLYLPPDYAPCSLGLPTCLRATAQHLAQSAATRGLFRIPGSARTVAALFDHYCCPGPGGERIAGTVRGASLPPHIACSVHDVASTFKRLLSVLPGGILGSLSLFDALVAIHAQLDGEPEFPRTKQTNVRARLIALAVGTVRSQFRRELISAVVGLLSLIGRVAEVTPREDADGRPLPTANLMGYHALGIVFGPLLVGGMLDQYTMRLASPAAGMLLLPFSPQKRLRRERRAAGRADGSAAGPPTVDKILVANGIAEMLIANWRDVVRQMRSLGAHHRRDASLADGRRGSLRPSTSETFAIRMPRGMGPGETEERRGSPAEPDTPTLGGLGRRRSRGPKTTPKKVRPRKSTQTLSPTIEEGLTDGGSAGGGAVAGLRGRERAPVGGAGELNGERAPVGGLGELARTQAPVGGPGELARKQAPVGEAGELARKQAPVGEAGELTAAAATAGGRHEDHDASVRGRPGGVAPDEAAHLAADEGRIGAAQPPGERAPSPRLDGTPLGHARVYLENVPPRLSSKSRQGRDSSEMMQSTLSCPAGDTGDACSAAAGARPGRGAPRRRQARTSNNVGSCDGSEDFAAPVRDEAGFLNARATVRHPLLGDGLLLGEEAEGGHAPPSGTRAAHARERMEVAAGERGALKDDVGGRSPERTPLREAAAQRHSIDSTPDHLYRPGETRRPGQRAGTHAADGDSPPPPPPPHRQQRAGGRGQASPRAWGRSLNVQVRGLGPRWKNPVRFLTGSASPAAAVAAGGEEERRLSKKGSVRAMAAMFEGQEVMQVGEAMGRGDDALEGQGLMRAMESALGRGDDALEGQGLMREKESSSSKGNDAMLEGQGLMRAMESSSSKGNDATFEGQGLMRAKESTLSKGNDADEGGAALDRAPRSIQAARAGPDAPFHGDDAAGLSEAMAAAMDDGQRRGSVVDSPCCHVGAGSAMPTLASSSPAGPGMRSCRALRAAPGPGTTLPHREQPPTAQPSKKPARPMSTPPLLGRHGRGATAVPDAAAPPAEPCCGSTTLFSQIQSLQRQLSLRAEEAAQLRGQLDAQGGGAEAGALGEQLRAARRERAMWRERAREAEGRVRAFEGFAARLRAIREDTFAERRRLAEGGEGKTAAGRGDAAAARQPASLRGREAQADGAGGASAGTPDSRPLMGADGACSGEAKDDELAAVGAEQIWAAAEELLREMEDCGMGEWRGVDGVDGEGDVKMEAEAEG